MARIKERVICEKGRRILEILGMSLCDVSIVERMVDYYEIFVYACVRKALGMRFEQKLIRVTGSGSLSYRPLDLREYIEDYIAWVFGEKDILFRC